jgi:hypothetical protein
VNVIWLAKNPELEMQSKYHAALFTGLIFNHGDEF